VNYSGSLLAANGASRQNRSDIFMQLVWRGSPLMLIDIPRFALEAAQARCEWLGTRWYLEL
jgi:hypothetical protein